jgi:hypothetical protein
MSGMPTTSRIAAINTLIAGLKADGIWAKLSGFYDFAAETEQHALLNWTRSIKGTNNGCTFAANAGYRCGTSGTAWIDLGFASGTYLDSLNDVAMGVWTNVAGNASASNLPQMGQAADGSRLLINASTGGNETFRCNDGTNSIARGAQASRNGHRALARRPAATSDKVAFLNGVFSATVTPVAATTLSIANFGLFRNSGTFNAVNDGICFAWVASALSDAEMANLHSRLATYKAEAGIAGA